MGTAETGRRITRRTLLLGGSGAAGGVLLSPRHGSVLPGGGKSAGAAGEFDVSTASELMAPTPLRHVTGPQSVSYGRSPDDTYALQLMPASVRLPDETRALGGRARRLSGDMCVTVLSPSGGSTGHMYLRGFGHGISFGVEPSDGNVLLWVESDADPRTGYGRAIARVPFRDGTVLDSSSPGLRHHRPVPGALRMHPTLDLANRRVLVSHWIGRRHAYAVYRMEDFLAQRYEPLYDFADSALKKGETFQGCALRNGYVYQLTGNPYSGEAGGNPPSAGGNTFVSTLDVNSGRTVARRRVTAAPELDFREPEGIAVRPGTTPRLCIAFSVKTPDRRRITVYSCGSEGVGA
ncbi:signaling protein [Streptomyces sp. NBC_00209]|uniref:phage baseplate protein n=1 Tax=Streptomyces sp. NBC_00209 TaxID=2975682 RepID=UPI003246E3E8